MKKVLKLALVAVMVLSSTTLFAQKLGRINTQEVLMAMPETKEAQAKLEASAKEWQENIEAAQVEFNNKFAEYQKNMNTMSDGVRQVKEKELQDMSNRGRELQGLAQQAIAQEEQTLMTPVIEKAQAAIKSVAAANGMLAVFEDASMIYYDETNMVNLTPLVKKELGITEEAAATAAN